MNVNDKGRTYEVYSVHGTGAKLRTRYVIYRITSNLYYTVYHIKAGHTFNM